MSSALAAFAKSQQAAEAAAPPEVDDEAYASDDDPPKEQDIIVAASKPATLADVARAQQEPTKKSITLADFARQQPSLTGVAKPTLLDVAKDHEARAKAETSSQLHAIAASVQAEEADASRRRAAEIDRALAVTSQQVKQEMQASQHSLVAQALQQAAQEEQPYDQQDDEFETDDPAVQRAAELVVEHAAAAPHANDKQRRNVETLSVDRHLLKQRQQHRGLASGKSTAKAKTMKEKLSAFQFQQLSLTQQRVFLAMLVDDENGQDAAKKKCNMHAIEELAKDRDTQLRQKRKLLKLTPPVFAKLDDSIHCRFKPKIKNTESASGRGRDDDDDNDDDGGDGGSTKRREDFIRRMEATERVRKETLRRTRAEREYTALIDKKECPQCGNPQSYAELTQKRKKCPNCGVTYKSRLAWSDIADAFLERMASHLQTHQTSSAPDNQAEHDSGERSNRPRKWCDVRDEFLGRVQLDLVQRELTKERILQELEAQCTFAPAISARARRLRLGDFDERLRRDLESRRVRQEQFRVLSAAIATAEANASRGAGGGAGGRPRGADPRAGLPRSFEQRLRADLEKRRERLAANENPNRVVAGRSRGLY